MNTVVVLLTANKYSADCMLTMNNLQSIVPLVADKDIRIIRKEFYGKNYEKGDKTYHMKWETYLNMEWDPKEMKEAILVHPSYENNSDQEKEDLELKIDVLLGTYTDEERKKLSPTEVLTALVLYSNSSIELMQTQSGISSRGQETDLFAVTAM